MKNTEKNLALIFSAKDQKYLMVTKDYKPITFNNPVAAALYLAKLTSSLIGTIQAVIFIHALDFFLIDAPNKPSDLNKYCDKTPEGYAIVTVEFENISLLGTPVNNKIKKLRYINEDENTKNNKEPQAPSAASDTKEESNPTH